MKFSPSFAKLLAVGFAALRPRAGRADGRLDQKLVLPVTLMHHLAHASRSSSARSHDVRGRCIPSMTSTTSPDQPMVSGYFGAGAAARSG